MDNLKAIVNETSLLVKQASLFLKEPINELSDGDNPSTNIDVTISDFLTTELKNIVNVDVLSEEKVDCFEKSEEQFWLIDPIDGTMNFISDSPDIAISVALVDIDFNAIMSVIYLPFYDEMYTAIKNNGAFLNGKILNKTKAKLNIVAYGLPGDAPSRTDSIMNMLTFLIKNNYILRQSGSAVVDICRVAKGSWQCFFEEGLFVWDVAGANLIAQESGCQSFTSIPDIEFKCNYIVSEESSVFHEIKTLLKGAA